MRGDLEAQRHWIALTSSYLSTWPRLVRPVSPPSSPIRVPPSRWYFHDTAYWGLDYPPLTAYHSMLMGLIARLSGATARFVTLRPASASATEESLQAWNDSMRALELEGGLQLWMRTTVIVGDLLVWLSAVVVFARRNSHGSKGHARHLRNAVSVGFQCAPRRSLCYVSDILVLQLVVVASIGLQPSLLLIDNGHFQCARLRTLRDEQASERYTDLPGCSDTTPSCSAGRYGLSTASSRVETSSAASASSSRSVSNKWHCTTHQLCTFRYSG